MPVAAEKRGAGPQLLSPCRWPNSTFYVFAFQRRSSPLPGLCILLPFAIIIDCCMGCSVLTWFGDILFVDAIMGLRPPFPHDNTAVRGLSHFCKICHRVNTWQNYRAKIRADPYIRYLNWRPRLRFAKKSAYKNRVPFDVTRRE
jgi:hypothetical protein